MVLNSRASSKMDHNDNANGDEEIVSFHSFMASQHIIIPLGPLDPSYE